MLRVPHPPPLLGSCDQRRSLYRVVEEMFDDSSVSDSSTTLSRWELPEGKAIFQVYRKDCVIFVEILYMLV